MPVVLYVIDGVNATTLEDFEADNADWPLDEEDMARIRALAPGEQIRIDLGAHGVTRVLRSRLCTDERHAVPCQYDACEVCRELCQPPREPIVEKP